MSFEDRVVAVWQLPSLDRFGNVYFLLYDRWLCFATSEACVQERLQS